MPVPCLTKRSMISYMMNVLNEIDTIRDKERRVEKINNLFTYILTIFENFIENFKENLNLLETIQMRCISFIKDEKATRFVNLIHNSQILLEKLNKEISQIQQPMG